MTKVIKLSIFFVFIYVSLFNFLSIDVFAQCSGDCVCVANGGETGGSCGPGYNGCDNNGSCSCTNWGPGCTSPTPPPSGGGNVSTCWLGAVNCGSGATISTNQPIETFCSGKWGYTKGMCTPIGSAQRTTGCCRTVDGECVNPQYTTYACCPSNTVDTKIEGANYTRTNSCYTPNVCNDSNDQYVTNVANPAAGLCFVGCSDYNPNTGNCRVGASYNVYNVTTTCKEIHYSCVSSCTSTAPTTVSNPTPGNGSTVTTTTVNLGWSAPSSWGTGCPTNNNRYFVHIGTSPSNMTQVQTVLSPSAPFTGTSGTTYYWSIYPNNGTLSAASPQVWSFTINVPPAITTPWWQIIDGDVTAANGGITSQVPATRYFNLDGTGTFPGVPVYSGGLSYTPGLLSSKNWSANTQTTQGRIFDFTFFKNLIPDNVTPTTNSSLIGTAGFSSDGYEWFRINGNVTLNTTNFGTRKVILFVENGNLNINGNLNVDDGVGFFGAFVDGNINVASTVTGAAALEGIYLSDGSFTTDLAASQLHIRGSVASFGGVSLQRNLVDDSIAAELFEYAPDQILLFPKKLAYRRTKWSEIAP